MSSQNKPNAWMSGWRDNKRSMNTQQREMGVWIDRSNKKIYPIDGSWNFMLGGENVRSRGAKGDGITDDSSAFSSVNTNLAASADGGGWIVVPPGTYRISSNLTLGSATIGLRFAPGAILSTDSGVTVTIGGAIDTGVYQIFSGAGSVVFSSYPSEIPAEWFGAVGDYDKTTGTDNTAAIAKAINTANGNTWVVFAGGSDYLVTGQLAITVERYMLRGSRSERGADPGLAAYNSSIISFRPTGNSTYMVKRSRLTNVLVELGPFIHEDLNFDMGTDSAPADHGNAFQFGDEDLAFPSGQAFIRNVRFMSCSFNGRASTSQFVSNGTTGVITRNGQIFLNLNACFETVIQDTTLRGGDIQVKTFACDKPLLRNIRSNGSHIPFFFEEHTSTFVQHTLDNVQVESWGFGAIINKSADVAVSNLRIERASNGLTFGEGVFDMTDELGFTANVTAGSNSMVFSATMTNVLFPDISVIQVGSDGSESVTIDSVGTFTDEIGRVTLSANVPTTVQRWDVLTDSAGKKFRVLGVEAEVLILMNHGIVTPVDPSTGAATIVTRSELTNCLVQTVSGTTVTIYNNTHITFTDATAHVTRIHDYGVLHNGNGNGHMTLTNVSLSVDGGAPAFVHYARITQMAISNAITFTSATPLFDIPTSMVIGNRFQGANNLQPFMTFSGCDPILLPNGDHPFVKISTDLQSNYGDPTYALGVSVRTDSPDGSYQQTQRKWVFRPGYSNTVEDTLAIPFIELQGDDNTQQRFWAWFKENSATKHLLLKDSTLPSDSTRYVRTRIKARSVSATGAIQFSFTGDGVNLGMIPTTGISLTDSWSIHEDIRIMPSQWRTMADPRGFLVTTVAGQGDVYIAVVTIEELTTISPNLYDAQTLSANATFTHGTFDVYNLTPTSADRNFNPSGQFPAGARITVRNSAAARRVFFDSAGINAVVAPLAVATFRYTGSVWFRGGLDAMGAGLASVATMTGNETFTHTQTRLYLRDPDGVDRNFNPSGSDFSTGIVLTLQNTGGANNVTFDTAGIAIVVATGKARRFAYNGSAWVHIDFA